jgi:hypothetical protein
MKSPEVQSQGAIEMEAKKLARKGLERWQVVIELNKVFGSKAVSEWLELETQQLKRKYD